MLTTRQTRVVSGRLSLGTAGNASCVYCLFMLTSPCNNRRCGSGARKGMCGRMTQHDAVALRQTKAAHRSLPLEGSADCRIVGILVVIAALP